MPGLASLEVCRRALCGGIIFPGHNKGSAVQVLHVATECAPIAKVGGLADVVGALPRYLTREGQPASVLIPWYGHLPVVQVRRVWQGEIRLGSRRYPYRIWRDQSGWTEFPLYLLEQDLFRPPGVYAHAETGQPFAQELERYVLLGYAALELAHAAGDRAPEVEPIGILHGHDHHAAFLALGMYYGPFSGAVSRPFVLTVHNALYQGRYPWSEMDLLPWRRALPRADFDHDGAFNALKAALLLADRVTTVSPAYAQELTEWAAGGLEYAFRMVRSRLVGILNGIDTERWDPAHDPYLAARYDIRHLERRLKNRDALGQRLGVRWEGGHFLLAFIGRLVPEKGVELLLQAAPALLEAIPEARLVVLGTGWPRLEEAFRDLEARFPERVRAWLHFDEGLAHLLYGSIDVLLMPSRTEPCGLNQLYALRYGAVPVVHPTGGLRDSVRPLDRDARRGTGFWMRAYSPAALEEAVRAAHTYWKNPKRWRALQRRGMREDFSWTRAVGRYLALYREIIEEKPWNSPARTS
jgi:starch synthase